MPAPIFAAIGRGLASAAQGAARAGAGLVRGAVSSARGAAGLFSRGAAAAPNMAQGAASASRYAAATGSRATAAAGNASSSWAAGGLPKSWQTSPAKMAAADLRADAAQAANSASQAGQQAAQRASAQVQQSAQSSIGSVRRMAQEAAQSIQRLAQQLFNLQAPGGGGGGNNQPPSGNAPPAGNQPPGRGGGAGRGPAGNFIGNQLRGVARQAAGTAVGQTVSQGLNALRLGMRYTGPTGSVRMTADMAASGGRAVMWLAKMPGRLKDFGDSLVKSREQLNEYNGSLAASAAKLEVERIGRNIRLGAATAGTGSSQTRSQSRIENNLLPMQALTANITNAVTTALQNAASYTIEGIGSLPVMQGLSAWLGRWVPPAPANMPLQQFAHDLGMGKFLNRRGPPIGRGP